MVQRRFVLIDVIFEWILWPFLRQTKFLSSFPSVNACFTIKKCSLCHRRLSSRVNVPLHHTTWQWSGNIIYFVFCYFLGQVKIAVFTSKNTDLNVVRQWLSAAAIIWPKSCSYSLYAVDGFWNAWAEWSECTTTCGGGTRYRNRTCVPPIHGGFDCPGSASDVEACSENPCPS